MIAADTPWAQLLEEVRAGQKVRTHSSRIQPGDVFVALSGSSRHGADFIGEALQRGAGVIVCEQEFDPGFPRGSSRVLYRPDTAQALGELAAAFFGTQTGDQNLIGVTGTNGKTTVCSGIEHLLLASGRRVGCLGTIAYRWANHEQPAALTTPGCLQLHEVLARMKDDQVDTVCMEVSSHALEQRRTAGLQFDLGLFTNLTHDHLDYHQDMEAYFQAKKRLFFPDQGKRPFPVVNLDDAAGRRLASLCETGLGFALEDGEVSGFDCLQGRLKRLDREGLELEMRLRGTCWSLQSSLIGRHNASNLLAVQAVGCRLGLSPEELQVLSDFPGVPGRLERVEGIGPGYVFIDYAHTPDALQNVLRSIRELDFQRVIAVFGCGGNRDRQKRPLMGQVVAAQADVAVLTSDNPRDEDPLAIMADIRPGLKGAPRIIEEPERGRAIELALHEACPGDALIIAGKGHETYQEIKGVKYPFSDRDVVLQLAGGADARLF